MSKRFGRNQKNRLQAQISFLKANLAWRERAFKELQAENAHITNLFETLVASFNEWWANCVLVDPRILCVQKELPPYFKLAARHRVAYQPYRMASETITCDELTQQMLVACKIAINHGLDDTMPLHIILKVGAKEYAYYIDPETIVKLKGIPAQMRTFLVQQVCQALDNYMLNDMCNANQGTNRKNC